MTFADILDNLGGMGHFQRLTVAFLALPLMMMASHNLLQNFTAGVPEHHCQIHITANSTLRHANSSQELEAAGLLRISIPLDRDRQVERCRRFVATQWRLLDPNASAVNETDTEPCADGWTYDRSVFASTIVSEWDLVCESRTLRQLAQSLYMAGVLIGSVLFGGLSDRFGRKALIVWSYLQMGAAGACTAFVPTFTAYCVCRFLTGMAMSGIVLNSVSLCMEWIPTKYRAIVGTINGYCYTTGQFILAGVAYLIPDWRWLQLTVSLPFLVFFLYSWFSTSFAYYGLAMDLQNFGFNLYLTQLVFGAVDIPAKFISVLTITFVGRRFSQALSLILAGLCILANIFVPQELSNLRMVFAVLGKGSLAASFNCAYIFSGELFPTVIRQSGMGLGGTMARVGSMIAPLVKITGEVFPPLPLIIYGAAPIISGIAACFLPETRNVPLPETIEQPGSLETPGQARRGKSTLTINRQEFSRRRIKLLANF
ncbi:hypothetical protein lerEdw1_007328 [Lerista edwardsae]|nr:hypothetical protein lerEdw1_007328 [Lerista edwardsae]